MSPYIVALINPRLHPTWLSQAIGKLAKPAAEVSAEGSLPKLRSAAAFPLLNSIYWTLPTMSGYVSPSSLFHWMLDCALAPLVPLVSCQEIFIRLSLSLDSWFVQTGFIVVQSIHIYRFDDGFDLVAYLKPQISRCVY